MLLSLSLLSGCGPVSALSAQLPRQARIGVLESGFAGSNAQPIGALDMYWAREFTDQGALLAGGGNRADAFRRAAGYVDKILHGVAPGDLPVEQASQFDFVINLKKTGTLGLTVNHELLVQATDPIR